MAVFQSGRLRGCRSGCAPRHAARRRAPASRSHASVDNAPAASLVARPYLPRGLRDDRAARAQMAELVDAPSSGGGARKGVEVRVLFWAPFFPAAMAAGASELEPFLPREDVRAGRRPVDVRVFDPRGGGCRCRSRRYRLRFRRSERSDVAAVEGDRRAVHVCPGTRWRGTPRRLPRPRPCPAGPAEHGRRCCS